MAERRRKVYAVMVADLFHYGHVRFLKKARLYGDYLVVGLMSDKASARHKRKPVLNLEERTRVIEACRYVDEVQVHGHHVTNAWLKKNGYVAKVHASYDKAAQIQHQDWNAEMEDQYQIEVPYEYAISTSEIISRIKNRGDL